MIRSVLVTVRSRPAVPLDVPPTSGEVYQLSAMGSAETSSPGSYRRTSRLSPSAACGVSPTLERVRSVTNRPTPMHRNISAAWRVGSPAKKNRRICTRWSPNTRPSPNFSRITAPCFTVLALAEARSMSSRFCCDCEPPAFGTFGVRNFITMDQAPSVKTFNTKFRVSPRGVR
ncbi:hypothetical protein D9M71_552020 [compost metagenome]